MSTKNDPTSPQQQRGFGNDGLLHGKVAQLLNVRQLAVNIGRKHGVQEGMYFAVLNRNAADIRDPDTHELLGSTVLPKVHVKVTKVEAEFCIADVEGTRFRKGFTLPAFFYTEYAEVPKTLSRSENAEVEEIEEKDSIVRIGDPVVQEKPPPES